MEKMTVTSLKELQGKRVRVYINDEPAFVLYKGELRLYSIAEGAELSEEKYGDILNVLLPKRAKMRAMNLLKSRPYTEKGLFDKLLDGDYPENAINEAMEYVKSFGYIDDEKYARDYIYTYKERKNKLKLTQDLLNKGISKDIINEALCDELGDEGTDLEKEQILKAIKKKLISTTEISYEDKQKLLASLYRKGYSPDLCISTLDKFLNAGI